MTKTPSHLWADSGDGTSTFAPAGSSISPHSQMKRNWLSGKSTVLLSIEILQAWVILPDNHLAELQLMKQEPAHRQKRN